MSDLEKMLAEKRAFIALQTGSVYKIPTFKVIPGIGLEKQNREILLPLVRGSRYEAETGTEFLAVEGTTQETLLAVLLTDLEEKNKIVPNADTELVIAHLEEALRLLEDRQRDRYNRNVLATYKE